MSNKEVEAIHRDGQVHFPATGDAAPLRQGGYGTTLDDEDVITFEPYEALHLLNEGRISVVDFDTGHPLDFKTLLQQLRRNASEVWLKYLVYRDLRSRGYVVRAGFGEELVFRVYGRGDYGVKAAKYIVFVVYEGRPVLIDRVKEVMRIVRNMKKGLIVAVMDRRGEIVYYTLSQLTLH
jgi:tRNA-intron endonuclease